MAKSNISKKQCLSMCKQMGASASHCKSMCSQTNNRRSDTMMKSKEKRKKKWR